MIMTNAFIFPGQGSQTVGMGRELFEAFSAARDVFQEVDDALCDKLSRIMFEGPESDLNLTEHAQPALMAVSLAVVRTLEGEGGFALREKAAFVAGHSLGEISALAAVGSFGLADTARLLRARGQAMQRAAPLGIGAMAALLGLDLEAVQDIAARAAQNEVCVPANDNAPGQVVVSGHKGAVERAVELAKAGGGRAIMLATSAPFHCPLMQPAAAEFETRLAAVTMRPPSLAVICNATARPETAPEMLRNLIVQQITALVRWRESVSWLRAQGVDRFIECGAGKVLSGLVKRTEKDVATMVAGSPKEIEAVLKIL
jgi:[acyl-carrier-protein] S-malonyltransferase